MQQKKPMSERLPSALYHFIYEKIASATMCWGNPSGAGIFKDGEAIKIANELCESVADELDKYRLPAFPPMEILQGEERNNIFNKIADRLDSGMFDDFERMKDSYKALEHYFGTTIGLWATDNPEHVYDPKNVMSRLWPIKDDAQNTVKPDYVGKMPQNRPVHFKAYFEPTQGVAGHWESMEGTFIQYGISFEKIQGLPGQFTTAIVEANDGRVLEILPKNMQFLDVMNFDKIHNDLWVNSIPGYITKKIGVDVAAGKEWRHGTDHPQIGVIVTGRHIGTTVEHAMIFREKDGKFAYQHANRVGIFYQEHEVEWVPLGESAVPEEEPWINGEEFPAEPVNIQLWIHDDQIVEAYFSGTTKTYHLVNGIDHYPPANVKWRPYKGQTVKTIVSQENQWNQGTDVPDSDRLIQVRTFNKAIPGKFNEPITGPFHDAHWDNAKGKYILSDGFNTEWAPDELVWRKLIV